MGKAEQPWSVASLPVTILLYFLTGAHGRTRTGDPVLTKNVLYQLSYVGLVAGAGFEPA